MLPLAGAPSLLELLFAVALVHRELPVPANPLETVAPHTRVVLKFTARMADEV